MLRLLLLFHRWVALGTGLIIVILALSGTAITVLRPLDRMLRPGLWRASPGHTESLDVLTARIQAALPGTAIAWVVIPPEPLRAIQMGTNEGHLVWLDGAAGTVLGIRTAEQMKRDPAEFARRLHGSLAIPPAGRALVLLGTLTALLLSLSGLWLWWPDKLWQIRGGSWKRVAFDLHHLLGVTGFALFVVMTLTGVILAQGLVGKFMRPTGGNGPQAVAQPAAAAGAAAVSLDSAVSVALAAVPGGVVRHLNIPRDLSQPITVALKPAGAAAWRPADRVTVDRYRGVALETRRAGEQRATVANSWLLAWHTGEAGGPAVAMAWAVASLALAVNALTGLMMWWNGRKARKALRLRAAAPAAVPAETR
jgi:uncharacterized iron-regulated membrane protein